MATYPNLEKRKSFSNDIIFIDGLYGTGKSLLIPILSCLDHVERAKIHPIYEYIGWLLNCKKITQDAALSLLRIYADSTQYNNLIGRELNLRPSDVSGYDYFKDKNLLDSRFYGVDGNIIVDQINSNNLAFSVMSHLAMLNSDILYLAFQKRLKVIEIVRHPLYLLRHFTNYLIGFDCSRDFTLSFYFNDVKVPCFASDWVPEYLQCNSYERAVLSISKLYYRLEKEINRSKDLGLSSILISFENLVYDTNESLSRLEYFLGRSFTPRIHLALEAVKLPRKSLTDGVASSYYTYISTDTDQDSYEALMQELEINCSNYYKSEMLNLISWYNLKFPSCLVDFQ